MQTNRAEYNAAYYAANREVECARSRKWASDHPERRKAAASAWYQKNKAKRREYAQERPRALVAAQNQKSRLKTLYGITPDERARLVAKQRGLCAACGDLPKRLVVDHDHATGKVRALLCDNCNIAAGHLKDDPVRAGLLQAYLSKTEA